MSKNTKLILGAILGYAGYVAYKKLQKTQTVTVNTFDTPIPEIIGGGSTVLPGYMTMENIAGLPRGLRGRR